MYLAGDATEIVFSFVPSEELPALLTVSSAWADNMSAQHRLYMDRLSARIVHEVTRCKHNVLVEHENQQNWPVSVVEEHMHPKSFDLLFGKRAVKLDDFYELQFDTPRQILDALPSLPIAVRNVLSNAPALPICPSICIAGYMDGKVKYDSAQLKLTLSLRSRVIKVAPYCERSLNNLLLPNYPDV